MKSNRFHSSLTKWGSILALFFLPFFTGVFQAEDERSIAGTWVGEIKFAGKTFPVIFEISEQPGNRYSAVMRYPSESDIAIPVNMVTVDRRKVILSGVGAGKGVYEGRLSTSKSIRGEWTTDGKSLPLTLKREDGGFSPDRPQTPKKPFPYEVVEVRVPNEPGENDLQLAGTLTKPSRPFRPVPAVVLLSDTGPHDRDAQVAGHRPFAVLADVLTRRGIAVLRYDERGIGQSSGDFASAKTKDYASDAKAAVNFLKKQSSIDPARIGLIGHGEGGLVASIVAAERDEIRFLVLLAGLGVRGDQTLLSRCQVLGACSGLPQDFIELSQRCSLSIFGILTQTNVNVEELRDLAVAYERAATDLTWDQIPHPGGAVDFLAMRESQFQMLELQSVWFANFLQLDPGPYLQKVTCPVLALNGDLDFEVVADLHLKAIKQHLTTAGNKQYEIRKLEGLNHLFQPAKTGFPSTYSTIDETIDRTVLRGLVDWISKNTKN